jgi:hypothetical protein
MFGKEKSAESLMSRQAILWMHPTSLLRFMTSKRWVILEGALPPDVQFHHVYWDAQRQVWAVICTSMEFKEVKLGQPLPEIPPVSFRFWNPKKDGELE